jgi:hypothetical protein
MGTRVRLRGLCERAVAAPLLPATVARRSSGRSIRLRGHRSSPDGDGSGRPGAHYSQLTRSSGPASPEPGLQTSLFSPPSM